MQCHRQICLCAFLTQKDFSSNITAMSALTPKTIPGFLLTPARVSVTVSVSKCLCAQSQFNSGFIQGLPVAFSCCISFVLHGTLSLSFYFCLHFGFHFCLVFMHLISWRNQVLQERHPQIFFCKEPESKYFSISGPYGLYCNYLMLLLWYKSFYR